jgi:hypothetical protein
VRIVLRIVKFSLAITSLTVVTVFAVDPWADHRAVSPTVEHAKNAKRIDPNPIIQLPGQRNNYLSSDAMLRASYLAASRIRDSKAPGGFARSMNFPRTVARPDTGSGFFLFAQPDSNRPFRDGVGMRLTVVNLTPNLLEFRASDSCLSIVQEALDAEGNWKPIEYLPSSFCGNSYHRVFLPPTSYWEFGCPRYQGNTQTRLRFSLQLSDGSRITSNEFGGSINPGQFTTKQGHSATNVMDPYLD